MANLRGVLPALIVQYCSALPVDTLGSTYYLIYPVLYVNLDTHPPRSPRFLLAPDSTCRVPSRWFSLVDKQLPNQGASYPTCGRPWTVDWPRAVGCQARFFPLPHRASAKLSVVRAAESFGKVERSSDPSDHPDRCTAPPRQGCENVGWEFSGNPQDTAVHETKV